MRTRNWFALSLLLFIAAALCWRLAEDRVKEAHKATAEKSAPKVPKLISVPTAPKSKIRSSVAAEPGFKQQPVLPEDKFAPYRLRNTAKSLDQLMRSDSALLLRGALIDTADAAPLKIPEHLRAP